MVCTGEKQIVSHWCFLDLTTSLCTSTTTRLSNVRQVSVVVHVHER
jgi:hypothetical protein